jgi:hypothetical protein
MRYKNVPQWDKNGGKRLSFGDLVGLNVLRLKNCKMLVCWKMQFWAGFCKKKLIIFMGALTNQCLAVDGGPRQDVNGNEGSIS